MKRQLMGAAAVAACLAVPAGASAHPSAYLIDAKVAPPGATNPTWEQLQTQRRYLVLNHGFPKVLRETNGLATGGLINYALVPGAYRSGLSGAQKLDAKHAIGAQPHAQCRVPALTSAEAVLSWQEADPFYDYVPFQATSANLDDDPASWLGQVKSRTGVDLTTVTDPEAACEALPGADANSYVKADELQTSAEALLTGYTEQVAAPMQTRIAALEAQAAAKDAEIARLTAANRTLKVTAPASIKCVRLVNRGLALKLDGPPGLAVTARLLMSDAKARKLGLKSGFLGSAKGTIGGDYTLPITLRPTGKVAPALLKKKAKRARATLEVTGGDRFARTPIALVK